MARKKWTRKEEETPSLLKFREKRKWQIALRRYVLEKNLCIAYAPYFGLDIANLRQWFEYQFTESLNWENFGEAWQFDHIIPVTYFDFAVEEDLLLCWNFINLRVEPIQRDKDRGIRLDVLAAKGYFRELHEKTGYPQCLKLLTKIESLEISKLISTEPQQAFITKHREYLQQIEMYSDFEFELLNRGRTVEQVNGEIDFLKRLDK